MFDEPLFRSWPRLFGGAALFALLFATAALMVEVLFEGSARLTSGVVGFGIAAFVGFVAVALLVRRYASEDP